jgi:hypothetical protein
LRVNNGMLHTVMLPTGDGLDIVARQAATETQNR